MTPVRVILTLIPFIWTICMIPFVNTVKPMILGLPFLAFWLVCSIPVSFICLHFLYKIDTKDGQED